MKDSKRPSRGSWASGEVNLRKEDFRLKVGVKSKTTSSNALRSKNHLAWYVAYNANPLEKKLSRMPHIKWKYPPKLILDPGWHVACGEESSEVDTQKYRETTVIEAVHPHLSAIPPCPMISPDMEGKHDDDSQIPLIPIVPIEEAAAIEIPFDTSTPVKSFNCHSTSESLTLSRCNSSVPPNPPTGEKSLLNVLRGLEGSDLAVAAGAAATVAAALESKHEIDTELLIKFLTDPEMMKTLVNKTGIGANSEPRFPSNSTTDPGNNIFVPVAMNQPIPIKESASDLGVTPAKSQPIPIKESASDLGVLPAKRAHLCSPNLMKNWSPAPLRSNSHLPLIQDLTNGAREPAIARSRIHGTTGTNEPRPLTVPTLSYNEIQYARVINQYRVPNAVPMLPLYPSFSKPNLEAASKPMFKQHPPGPPPSFTGIKPVSFPPPFSSTLRPYVHCMTDGYRALDHVGSKPFLGSKHPMPFALGLNVASGGTFHPCPHPYSYMNKLSSPVEEVNFCKSSLIKQHGEKHMRNEDKLPNYEQPFNNLHEHHTNPLQINPTFQKLCMFFNSSKGCRKGSNCRYMHIMS